MLFHASELLQFCSFNPNSCPFSEDRKKNPQKVVSLFETAAAGKAELIGDWTKSCRNPARLFKVLFPNPRDRNE